MPAVQMRESDVAAAPFDKRADRRPTRQSYDQIALQSQISAASFDHIGAYIDRLGLGDEPNPAFVGPGAVVGAASACSGWGAAGPRCVGSADSGQF